jgi:hypothetical protein
MLKKQKEIAEGEHGVSSVRCKSLQLSFGRKCAGTLAAKSFFDKIFEIVVGLSR